MGGKERRGRKRKIVHCLQESLPLIEEVVLALTSKHLTEPSQTARGQIIWEIRLGTEENERG